MSKIFYIADTHFGHKNIITFDQRPFSSVKEMDETLINNWNSVVDKNDTVYILGDFCWLKEDRWIEILDKLNGGKQLIVGNHDLKNMSKNLRSKFQDVKERKKITDNGRNVIMDHFPVMAYEGSYNPSTYMLHGHVHNCTKESEWIEKWVEELRNNIEHPYDSNGNIINVGCMMPWINYTPRTLDEILEAKGWE